MCVGVAKANRCVVDVHIHFNDRLAYSIGDGFDCSILCLNIALARLVVTRHHKPADCARGVVPHSCE